MSDVVGKFAEIAELQHESYASADPFPHIVIDGLFDDATLDRILEEWPKKEDPIWHRSEQSGIQVKLRSNWESDSQIAPITKQTIDLMNSGDFLRALSKLTGIEGLITDPYMCGGGLNCILPGGQLAVHCDGNWNDLMRVHRRLNAILFVNKNWKPEWRGQLEFWDRDLKACVKAIDPVFNRLVIFTTHDFTYHGHPEPLVCPPGESRKSLILYYYTSYPREADQIEGEGVHRAQWKVQHDGQDYSRVGQS